MGARGDDYEKLGSGNKLETARIATACPAEERADAARRADGWLAGVVKQKWHSSNVPTSPTRPSASFSQDFGATYDAMRGLPRYVKKQHLPEIIEFFDGRCCYCGAEFDSTRSPVEDHLIPLNQAERELPFVGQHRPELQFLQRCKARASVGGGAR